ncbi:uncharacterized protein LOC134685303 isoform X2 [Mytilus trossulus]|uniref:uncharacterized protein LOC134685303 isoform X2 n=2 Tax=Mytilus trossulus TaxID=6551 RepID=UPI0030075288
MKPPKRQRKPRGMPGQSLNKKKKTQETIPEQSESTDKETAPFQSDLSSISVASGSGSDQPVIDQTPPPSQNPVPRQHIASSGVKSIWLIGSSIVYWANKEASSRPGGLHLGLQNTGAHMVWIGQRGMKWGDLNRVFEQRLINRPLPSFLVIQLGSNDLGILTSEKLFSDIECDLLRLHALYPALKIIWSDILMRRYWHNANCGQAIERARKRVNLRVKNLVLSIGGCAIRHSNIRAKESNLFRYDGTHLSKIGNDIYLNNLQGALEQFMRSGGPAVFPQ